MKTTAQILLLLLFLAALHACHLERLDGPDPTCDGTPPSAAFSTSPVVCGLHSPVTITNRTSGAATYVWDFGDDVQDLSKDPAAHTYNAVGTYHIRLIARSPGGCFDTAEQTVTVAVLKYKTKLLTGNLNTYPLGLTQRPSGGFNVLYNNQSNEFWMAAYSPLGQPDTAVQIPTTIQPGGTVPEGTGGVVLGGANGNLAKVVFLRDGASILAQPEFQFALASSSAVYGVTLASQVVGTGVGIKSSGVYPGLALMSTSGVLNSPLLVESTQTKGYFGISVAQRPEGSYLVAANCWSGGCSPACKVIGVSASGGYLNEYTVPLTQIVKIIRLSGDNYALIGYSASSPKIVGLNAATAATWTISLPITDVSDLIETTDHNLVVCGTLQQKIYLAKYPPANPTALFAKTVSETAAELYGFSVVQTADGGYALLAQIVTNGVNGLYLLKTDGDGAY